MDFKVDIFCVDCDVITTQTHKGTIKDGTRVFDMYTCDRCGCENTELKCEVLHEAVD